MFMLALLYCVNKMVVRGIYYKAIIVWSQNQLTFIEVRARKTWKPIEEYWSVCYEK